MANTQEQMDSMLPAVDDDTRSTQEYLEDTKPMDISSVPAFQRPMDASTNDQLVGEDDAGNPVYRTMLGNTYTVRRNPDQRTTRTKIEEDVLPAVKNWLQNPEAPNQDQILNIGKGIAESVYDLVSIPADLATGERSASDITLGDVYDTTGMMAVGSLGAKVPEGALRTFGGSRMELDSNELSNFKKARDLMKAEISNIDPNQYDQFYWANKKVWDATGWYINPSDKQWRYEIDDKKSKINWNNANISDVTGSELKENFETLPITKPDNDNGIFSSLGKKARTLKLSDFFTHDNLYKRYPFLKNLDVEFYNEKDTTLGSFTPGTDLIKINVGSMKSLDQSDPRFRSTLLHEIQHAIQHYEGFGKGANPRYIPDEATKDLVEKSEAIKSEAKNNIRKNAVDLSVKHGFNNLYDYFPLPSDLDKLGKKTYYDLIDENEAMLLEESGIQPGSELYTLITNTADQYRKYVDGDDITKNMEFKFYLGADGEIESRLVQATLEDSAYQGTYPIDRANKMLNERDPDRYDEFVNTPEFRGKVGRGDKTVRTPDIGEADVYITPEKPVTDYLPEIDPSKPGYNMEFTVKDEIKAKTAYIKDLFKNQPKLKKLFNIKPGQKFTLNYEDGPLEVEFRHYSFQNVDKKNLRGEGSIIIGSEYDKLTVPTAVIKYPEGNNRQISIMELINRSSLVKDFDIQDLRKTQKSPPGFLTNLKSKLGLKPTASSEGANFTLEDFGYYVDNPAKWGNTDWAKQKQAVAEKYAREGGKSAKKLLSGPQTAFLGIDNKKPLYLDTEFLSTLKGANDEVADMSNPKYVDLKKSVEEEGFVPDQKGNKILIGINHKGEAFIMEGNNRVAIAKKFGAPSVKAEVRYYNGAEEVDGPYSPQNILKYASQAPRQFAEGGTVDMNQQMSFAFEDGGLRDDGMMRDPVSGNEVPPGSTAKEVRDDIPAQLSEGEYVVPADVVRYYGVKFFEDLRDNAKMGLQDMESRGRIGGEPVPANGPMNNDDLSPEEMAAIQEMMGMAEGGAVNMYKQQQDLYSPPNPAIGNPTTGMAAGGEVRGYNSSSVVTTPQQQAETGFYAAGQQAQNAGFIGFPLGSTIFPSASTGTTFSSPTTGTTAFTPVNMINMQTGARVTATTQADYDRYISEGYVVDDGTLQPKGQGSGGGGGGTTPPPTEPYKDWLASGDFNSAEGLEKFVAGIEYDPTKDKTMGQAFGATLMGGPMAGIATAVGSSARGGLNAISDLRAASLIAKAQGLDKLAAKYDKRVADIIEKGPGILDFLDDIFATGKQKANAWAKKNGHENIQAAIEAGVTPTPPKPPATPSGDNDKPNFTDPIQGSSGSVGSNVAEVNQITADTGQADVNIIDAGGANQQITGATQAEVDYVTSAAAGNKGGLMNKAATKKKAKRQYKKGGLANKK